MAPHDAPQALARFKTRVRKLRRRIKGASLEQTIVGLLTIDGRIAASPALDTALSNAELTSLGLPAMQPKTA